MVSESIRDEEMVEKKFCKFKLVKPRFIDPQLLYDLARGCIAFPQYEWGDHLGIKIMWEGI
jgi:hypothetical protein